MLSDSGQVEDNVIQDDQSDQSIDTTEGAGQVDQPTKDEGDNGVPKGVQKRIDQIYGQKKQLERENETLKSTIKELTESSKELISEIRSDKNAAELASIERKINDAFDQGDKDAHESAKKELYEFIKSNAEKQRVATPAQQDTPGYDPIQEFKNRNPEFGNNKRFTDLAIKTEQEVINDPSFRGASIQEIYYEVEQRVRANYNAVQNPYLQQSSLTSAGSDSPPITEKKKSPSEAYLSSMSDKEKDALYEYQKQYHPGKSRDEVLEIVASFSPQGS